jgi:hypothetical protein
MIATDLIVRADTPLCPAGHLPHKGGDQPSSKSCANQLLLHPSRILAEKASANAARLVISPLMGEMADKPKGGEPPASPFKRVYH